MKKFLALFLVLVLAFTCILVSCKKDDSGDPEPTTDEPFIGVPSATTTVGSTTTAAQTGGTASDYTWTDVNEKVYVNVDALNVRSDTNYSDSTYKSTAYFGESYTRLKKNDVWSLIDYKGNQYYVATKHLTVEAEAGSIIFTDDATPSKVYVNVENTLNLRSSTYTADRYKDNIATSVKRGVELTRIGISQNGNWVKVRFEGIDKDLYCNTANVSVTPPTDSTTGTPTPTPKPQG